MALVITVSGFGLILIESIAKYGQRELTTVTVTKKNVRPNCNENEVVKDRYGVVPWCVDFETDKGRFGFPDRERIIGWPIYWFVQLDFWNDDSEVIWDTFRIGCTYEVVIEPITSFYSHQKNIVRVLKEISEAPNCPSTSPLKAKAKP